MSYVFPLLQTSLACKGTDERFPVRRVFCVGQNYADHALEMGSDPNRESPFFFTKPGSALHQNSAMPFPTVTNNLHHEVELVVCLKSGGVNIKPDDVDACIYGYAVGIDLTRRDLQAEAKSKGRPWDTAKGFDQAGPVSKVIPKTLWQPHADSTISLRLNGDLRQQATLGQLIWSVPELIAELSKYYCLESGDVIFTGTPAGVGPIAAGDLLEAEIAGMAICAITIG